ncbi:cell division protein FtsZ [uncultured Sphingomonas sp.]|uniref:cell division protein FtsZ n=1 Tax=uncultured Sphingomonas sp. TaxID=158754 RepID=UPI0025D7182F|nr:cell division protein FtsZ [uncultured Sphingomonas sp.]
MSIEFLPPDVDELTPRISVIGVGGAGGNAIANMIRADVQGVEFLVANTDAQALKQSEAPTRIQLGTKITQGLGAGSRPEIGRAAAEETIEQIQKSLEGAHMCFIAAGMGGGTGTGAAPVIAKAARDMGILTVGVVTKPFAFEGKRRAQSAETGIEELQKFVDTLIVIPNQNLFLIANANTTFKEAFELADEVLQQGVRGITDLMVMPGLINLDFADVRSVMQEMGKAMMGTGESSGDARAIEAAQKAIANPLLDGVSMRGAKGVIVSITGGDDMRLLEVDEAANHIRELVDPDANIIWGSAFNPDLEGKIRVSVVATGIEAMAEGEAAPAPVAEAPRVFSFNAPRRPEPAAAAPVAAAPIAPQPAPAPAPEETYGTTAPIPSQVDAGGYDEPTHVSSPAAVAARGEDDELVLGSDAMMDVPPSQAPAQPQAYGDLPAEPSIRRRWLTGATDEPAAAVEPAPRVKMGGTLFERMSGRGPKAEDDGEGKAPVDIPRFLHRQNNQ